MEESEQQSKKTEKRIFLTSIMKRIQLKMRKTLALWGGKINSSCIFFRFAGEKKNVRTLFMIYMRTVFLFCSELLLFTHREKKPVKVTDVQNTILYTCMCHMQ